MPNRDGMGPAGNGSVMGLGRKTATGGRMGGAVSAGPVGSCVCPKCGAKITHQRAEPCYSLTCPHCGAAMTRV
jgi:hypothetical protein